MDVAFGRLFCQLHRCTRKPNSRSAVVNGIPRSRIIFSTGLGEGGRNFWKFSVVLMRFSMLFKTSSCYVEPIACGLLAMQM